MLTTDKRMAEELEEHPLLFTVDTATGAIISVAAPDAEPIWCTNIKRGIVSLLQVQLPRDNVLRQLQLQLQQQQQEKPAVLYDEWEHDILGECLGHFNATMSAASGAVTLFRTKTLPDDCRDGGAVHHGTTHEADRHIMTKQVSGMLQSSHTFNVRGHLDKIEFVQNHDAAIHGKPNSLTRSISRGFMRFESMTALKEEQQKGEDGGSSRRAQRSIGQFAERYKVCVCVCVCVCVFVFVFVFVCLCV